MTTKTNYQSQHKSFLTVKPNQKDYFMITKGRKDLVIHQEKTAQSPVPVIIEAESPANKAEMPTKEELNRKAPQELLLYCLRERISHGNLAVKHLIITNHFQWFVFGSQQFEKHFASDKKLVKQFEQFESKQLIDRKKESERNTASLLENTIIQLDSLDKLSRLDKRTQFGKSRNEQLFQVGLELCITWIKRILFIKLLAAQLLSYHKGEGSFGSLGNNFKLQQMDGSYIS